MSPMPLACRSLHCSCTSSLAKHQPSFRPLLCPHACDASCAQITSLFLHFFPACVAWAERWHTGRHSRTLVAAFSQQDPEPREWADASFSEVVLFPMVPYLAWAVLYYAKVRWGPPAGRPDKRA